MAAIGDKPFPSANEPLRSSTPGSPQQDLNSSASTGPSSGSTMPTEHFTRTTGDSGGSGSGDMLGRVVQGAHQTIDKLAESAAPHLQRLQEGVGARADQVKQVSDEWAESLRGTVRDNPLAAVATALALGVLIARLTR